MIKFLRAFVANLRKKEKTCIIILLYLLAIFLSLCTVMSFASKHATKKITLRVLSFQLGNKRELKVVLDIADLSASNIRNNKQLYTV